MIAVIRCCGSNFASLQCAFQRLGVEVNFTNDPVLITQASHVIVPGVGHMAPVMQALTKLGLADLIKTLKQPVLGICLGMQIFYEFSAEGDTACLGKVPGTVSKLSRKISLRTPKIGWDRIEWLDLNCALFDGISLDAYFYFVHSYAAPVTAYTVASANHTEPYAAVVKKDNFMGVQFHPEKSGKEGEKLLQNFLRMR